MFIKVFSVSVIGMDSYPIAVEVDVSDGLPQFATVGLPDASVKESRDRIRAAIRNSGYPFPRSHVTVNLAPADLRKEGTGFDLPIAVGILAARRWRSPDIRRLFLCRRTVPRRRHQGRAGRAARRV
jgi:magnesium chelatase family protein